jgi:hypothetical protein
MGCRDHRASLSRFSRAPVGVCNTPTLAEAISPSLRCRTSEWRIATSHRAGRSAATFQNCNTADFPVVRLRHMSTRDGWKADSRHTRFRRRRWRPVRHRCVARAGDGFAVAFARHRFSPETGRSQPAAGVRAPPRQATEMICRFTTVSKLKHLVRRQVSRCTAMPAHHPKCTRRRPWHAPCVRSGGAGPTVPRA